VDALTISKTPSAMLLIANSAHFQAIVGLNDQSLDDIPVEIEIDADGRILYSGTFTAGKIVDVKENIAGVRELDLEQTYVGPNPNICSSNVTAVWGNAEVLP
jgi:hypothetical protein